MIHAANPLCSWVKSILVAIVVLLGVTGCVSKDQPSPSPFTDNSPRLEWPNIDISLFIASAAHYYHDKGTWPQSVDAVNEGFRIWIKTLSEKDSKDLDLRKITPFKDTFQIVEVVPMWHGVAYRLKYTKMTFSTTGLIVLAEEESADAISKSVRVSQELGGIIYAVPF